MESELESRMSAATSLHPHPLSQEKWGKGEVGGPEKIFTEIKSPIHRGKEQNPKCLAADFALR